MPPKGVFDAMPRSAKMAKAQKPVIEGPLGRAHRRPSIFDRRVWVPMCEEEHAIDNLRPLETIIMSYLFREGMVLCFATRR